MFITRIRLAHAPGNPLTECYVHSATGPSTGAWH